MKEVDLYSPVKNLLVQLGYVVKGEVANMDVVGLKGEEFVVVELKTSFTLKLLLQATQRQKLTENVYVAIPSPTGRQRFSKAFKEYEHLLKRLELGLILVFFKETSYAELIFEPKEHPRKTILSRYKKRSKAALQEARDRHEDYNIGGTNGKLMTVYREKALLAASYLIEQESMSAKDLREVCGIEKTAAILSANHYGWFEKAGRGRYRLTRAGEEALETFDSIVCLLRKERDSST